MQFTVHSAKSQLSKLIEAALRGEDVVIARANKPVVRLVPVAQSDFVRGPLKGQLRQTPDFITTEDSKTAEGWGDS